jgi:hypothetical protein
VSYKVIEGHLRENHLDDCCEYFDGGVIFLCRITTNMICIYFIFPFNGIFFSLFEEEDNIFYAVLLYLVLLNMQVKLKNMYKRSNLFLN